jgi:basic membrane protein A and related proteins
MIPISRRRGRTLIGALAALSLVLAACGGDDANDGSSGDPTGPEFIYLPPTPIGGNPFLEMGWTGTQNAAAKLNGTARIFESTDLNSRRANLEAAIEATPAVIIMNTFDFTDLAAEYAPQHPEQSFIIIDSCPDSPPANLFCGVFREFEASYLLGVMAGHLSEAKSIGSVVALDIPFLHRWSDSFALGAQSVDPSITDSQVFIGGESPFTDPARAKEQALSLAAQGLDHIFAVGAGSNGGIFEAATERGFYSYGVDVNECPKAPGQIVDNALKLVDVLVESMIDLILAGETESSFVSFGLANGGMSVMALQDDVADSGCVIADYPDLIEIVRGVADQIISGELVVPDPLFAS